MTQTSYLLHPVAMLLFGITIYLQIARLLIEDGKRLTINLKLHSLDRTLLSKASEIKKKKNSLTSMKVRLTNENTYC